MDMSDVNTLYAIALVMFVSHWVGDFVLQSHWMASNKSKNFVALGLHVAIYTATISIIPLIMCISGLVLLYNVGIFLVVNFLIHIIVDAITSRISSKLWMKNEWHNFFVVIGFDQLLHVATLLITMMWLINSIAPIVGETTL